MKLRKKLDKYIQRRDLDFEDVLVDQIDLDYSKEESGFEEKRIPIPLRKSPFIVALILISVFFLIVLGRIIYLQVKGSEYYKALAEKSRSRVEWVMPHRGIIYGRNQKQLVYNIPIYSLSFDLEKCDQEEDLALSNKKALDLFGIELEPLISKNEDNKLILLKEGLSSEEVFAFRSQEEELPCLSLNYKENRDYLDNESLSHVLGYIGKITQDEYARKADNYLLEDFIGKVGLELQYEKVLRGKLGIKSKEVSPLGEETRPLNEKEPQDGFSVLTSIDYGLQDKSYKTLKQTLIDNNLDAGAVLAINPQNGDILSLVSLPSFNNNLLSQGIEQDEFNRLLYAKDRPFFNRAISGTYPPGSTFKPLVAMAALEENIIDPEEGFQCRGFLRVLSKYNPNISYLFRDWKTHGWTNMKKAIAESCNVYFYIIGGGYEEREGLGIEKIKTYAKKIGLGEKTGIDLAGEAEGLIPDKKWKKTTKEEDWYIGDTYHASIGQGDISLTPLQVAQIYSFVSNLGKLYQPRLLIGIEEIPGSNKFNQIEPELISSNIFNKENIKIVKEGLGEAVKTGSAQILQNLPVNSGAKTGTAQFGDGSQSHAWFAAFAPYENPEIVLVTLVEAGGGGSAVAAPVAYQILKYYFEEKNAKSLEN